MSAGAKAKGVKGVVIDGRVRDLSEHRAMNFPVFARSHSILPQNAFVRPSEVQVPITLSTISPVVVHPSDIIVADLDGIICVPKHLFDAVLLNCAKYVAIDDLCMNDIQQGKGVKETFQKYRGT